MSNTANGPYHQDHLGTTYTTSNGGQATHYGQQITVFTTNGPKSGTWLGTNGAVPNSH